MLSEAEKKRIYCVGVGGIGLSGLALLLEKSGHKVAGSDIAKSHITDNLIEEGIEITLEADHPELPAECQLLIYSSAIPEKHTLRQAAESAGIRELSYPEALGEFLETFETLIAISGTNGKTTASAMAAQILKEAGLKPTALVGSLVSQWGSNVLFGENKYFVLEADEYRRAFLNYYPSIAAITNIAYDHPDYFKDFSEVKQAFHEFISQVKPGGSLIYNRNDKETAALAESFSGETITANEMQYDLSVPGQFNQDNAAIAETIARKIDVPESVIKSALKGFKGTWRRFEKVGVVGNTEIRSDYGHHPDAIRATMQMVSEQYPKENILLVFQPHQRARTRALFEDFVTALSASSSDLIIPEIFEVRGRDEHGDLSSRDLTEAIKKTGHDAKFTKDLAETKAEVLKNLDDYDLVIFMGAGDIYQIAESIVKA